MELKVLVYNVKNKDTIPICNFLNELLRKENFDILVLIECLHDKFSSLLNEYEEIAYVRDGRPRYSRVFLKTKKGIEYDSPTILLGNKIILTKLKCNNKVFNLGAVHFYSKSIGKSDVKQITEMDTFSKDLLEFEGNIAKCNKTILAGDFNSKPYDTAMNHPSTVIALNSKELINFLLSKTHKYNNRIFYNPMWNLLGDHHNNKSNNSPGTFFYDHDFDPENVYWSLIDGVILRPNIMDSVDLKLIRIIKSFNNHLLSDLKNVTTNSNFLDKENYSDHLPIKFIINLNRI